MAPRRRQSCNRSRGCATSLFQSHHDTKIVHQHQPSLSMIPRVPQHRTLAVAARASLVEMPSMTRGTKDGDGAAARQRSCEEMIQKILRDPARVLPSGGAYLSRNWTTRTVVISVGGATSWKTKPVLFGLLCQAFVGQLHQVTVRLQAPVSEGAGQPPTGVSGSCRPDKRENRRRPVCSAQKAHDHPWPVQ